MPNASVSVPNRNHVASHEPLISVLIDTYNHERYIEQAIVSALEQDFPAADVEILVVDDGSIDKTSSIIQRFVPRVRYLRKENGGQASAFNAGIPELRGRIVAFLDGDDWWAKGKLTAIAKAFEVNPEIAAVGHGFYEICESDPPREMIVPANACRFDLSSADAARFAGRGLTLLGTSRLSVRREVLNQIGPIPVELVFCADTPILALTLALGGAVILDQPLCYYRIHAGNLCAPGPNNAAKIRRIIEISEIFLRYIPIRLAEFGVPSEVTGAFFESIRVDLERTKLQSGEKGGRWKVFRTEWDRFHTCYRRPTLGYLMFECAVGACALLLPPRRFYQLLAWYGRNDLGRFRNILGRAEPKVPPEFFQRRTVAEGANCGRPD
ncbi:MAG: glycosyltransferase family A protein [Candidatus Acidiferrales bacterium]